MKEKSLSQFITTERKRLKDEKAEVEGKRTALDARLAEIQHELAAIDAYEAARTGKPARTVSAPKATRKKTRGRRGSRREEVLTAIRKHGATGVSRADLLAELGVKGNKSAEQSVSNALANMKKLGIVDNKNRSWVAKK